MTGWKRRSRAASFSTYFLYSEIVVAPISWISPLARDGFNILEASIAPSAPPAPIIVCISSIKRITLPLAITSLITFLILSSNSPRYLLPATIPDKSRVITRLSCTVNGTSPATIRRARPSTTAVFPTPGSPIRQGLFFVLLLNIWITLPISSSRPITGSNSPFLARAVRSRLYCSSTEAPPFFLPPCFFAKSSLYNAPSCPMAISVST